MDLLFKLSERDIDFNLTLKLKSTEIFISFVYLILLIPLTGINFMYVVNKCKATYARSTNATYAHCI